MQNEPLEVGWRMVCSFFSKSFADIANDKVGQMPGHLRVNVRVEIGKIFQFLSNP